MTSADSTTLAGDLSGHVPGQMTVDELAAGLGVVLVPECELCGASEDAPTPGARPGARPYAGSWWRFDVAPFTIAGTPSAVVEDVMTCDPCRGRVKRGDWSAALDRYPPGSGLRVLVEAYRARVRVATDRPA